MSLRVRWELRWRPLLPHRIEEFRSRASTPLRRNDPRREARPEAVSVAPANAWRGFFAAAGLGIELSAITCGTRVTTLR